MSFQADEILRKLRSSQDSKSNDNLNKSEGKISTSNDGRSLAPTTSATRPPESKTELNLNGSTSSQSTNATNNMSKDIQYRQDQNQLHEKLCRSFTTLLNQNSNPNTSFINTRYGHSDLKNEMEVELQKCYETIRLLRVENKSLMKEKKSMQLQLEQQKLKSDNIIVDLRCKLALTKTMPNNIPKSNNTINVNLKKGSRFAKPLNDTQDINTIQTLAQNFIQQIKPESNHNITSTNNLHMESKQLYNNDQTNDDMMTISGVNGELSYSANTSYISSHHSQTHGQKLDNHSTVMDPDIRQSGDDDVMTNTADGTDDNSHNNHNNATLTSLLLDTITGVGGGGMIRNSNEHENYILHNQFNMIPSSSSSSSASLHSKTTNPPSVHQFQSIQSNSFLHPSFMFGTNYINHPTSTSTSTTTNPNTSYKDTTNNTNTNTIITSPHFNPHFNSTSTNYVTPIPTIDSKQYQQHNAQQIHQLELMQNMYRNHLHQISLRSNQAQKLNMQQRVTSKKEISSLNGSGNSNSSSSGSGDVNNTKNNNPYNNTISNINIKLPINHNHNDNNNMNNNNNAALNSNSHNSSSSSSSSPAKEDVDPRYSRPVWNRNSPLSSPHKGQPSSSSSSSSLQYHHQYQQYYLQQQHDEMSPFLSRSSQLISHPPSSYTPPTNSHTTTATSTASPSSLNHFTLADLAYVKKYNNNNNNRNNNNDNRNNDNDIAITTQTKGMNRIDNGYNNTADEMKTAHLIHHKNNDDADNDDDDNVKDSDDESSNLEFDLDSYL